MIRGSQYLSFSSHLLHFQSSEIKGFVHFITIWNYRDCSFNE